MTDPNPTGETCPHTALRTPHTALRKQVIFICLLLTFVTIGVYWPVARHAFINFDDPDYVSGNPRVQAGLTPGSVQWAFTSFYASNWHPLTWLSHMLDCEIYGLRAGGHHVTSLLFHIANSLLLFGLLKRLTGALWRSALVAALFALHPLHVESVAWVSERKDVLSAFFFMLTLGAYARYAEVQSPGADAPRTTHHAPPPPPSRFTFHVSRFTLLHPLPLLLRPWPNEQADASDSAFCAVAAGLLAAGPLPVANRRALAILDRTRPNPEAFDNREDSFLRPFRCLVCADFPGAKSLRCHDLAGQESF